MRFRDINKDGIIINNYLILQVSLISGKKIQFYVKFDLNQINLDAF